ncbi:MAG: TrkH family potassium uptake protein [Elusimicrobia bacterium]|nr:TrkH family potassium uptake protein [Elusimicrobiota bacterium]
MRISPSQTIVLYFLSLILLGSFLLSLPVSAARGENVPLIDAIFTATSAICVTGLTTVDIGATFSLAGQIIILVWIQLGGLGYMTLATLIAVAIGKVSIKDKLVLREIIDPLSFEGLLSFLKKIIWVTLMFELAGAIVLTVCFLKRYPLAESIYYGIFHSISGFCNAGLSVLPGGLMSFKNNAAVLLTMALLIIIGGIGYIVIMEVGQKIRSGKRFILSLHSRVVIAATLILIVAGTLVLFLLEFGNPGTWGGSPSGYKLLNAFFQSVTPRTAGFSTVAVSNLTIPAIFVLIILMFIGASPGGTGGGIKTTTFSVLFMTLFSILSGKKNMNVFKRRIPNDIIMRSLTIFAGSIFLLAISIFLLLITQQKSSLHLIFEAVSAFSTVGLSLGVTPQLSNFGKLLIILVMLAGRVGPLTLGIALLFSEDRVDLKFPEEKIMVG